MNRRNFLKLIGVAPVIPGVLMAVPSSSEENMHYEHTAEECLRLFADAFAENLHQNYIRFYRNELKKIVFPEKYIK